MTDFERQEYSRYGIPQFIEYFRGRFNGAVTRNVYAEYLKFWNGRHVSKIAFSRYITRLTTYRVKSISILGAKYRVFTSST